MSDRTGYIPLWTKTEIKSSFMLIPCIKTFFLPYYAGKTKASVFRFYRNHLLLSQLIRSSLFSTLTSWLMYDVFIQKYEDEALSVECLRCCFLQVVWRRRWMRRFYTQPLFPLETSQTSRYPWIMKQVRSSFIL